MRPGVLVTGFCAAMAAIAVGRLVADERRDCVEIGSALVIVGFTLLSAAWAVFEATSLGLAGPILLAIGGTAAVAGGVAVMVRHWDERREPIPQCD